MEKTAAPSGKGRSARDFVFEITGGDPALDFVNTVDMRPAENRRELLASYELVCNWARQAGLIDPSRESLLKEQAKLRPEEAERARERYLEARECLFEILAAVSDGKTIPQKALGRWNELVGQALRNHRLVPSEDHQHPGLTWQSSSDPDDFDSILWAVIRSAATLLTGPDVPRIRRCAADRCDWIFLDRSKRGNRRWCDMSVCGNRAKARRFYRRKKKSD